MSSPKSRLERRDKFIFSDHCPYCQASIIPGEVQCPQCKKYIDGKERVEFRCQCGSLLCKMTLERIEIKCRKCKRIIVIFPHQHQVLYHKLKERENEKRRC